MSDTTTLAETTTAGITSTEATSTTSAETTTAAPLVTTTAAPPQTAGVFITADLLAVETAIRNRMTGGAVASYTINGRNLTYITLKELLTLRSLIRRELYPGNDNPVACTSYTKL